jgi:ribosome maturation factor RimP
MKTNLKIAAAVAVLFSTTFFSAQAQSENPIIKVLPTNNEGIVKLLFVGESKDGVHVRFYNETGLVEIEKVKSATKAFNKRYDVRNILDDEFAMEVSSAGTSVTYKLVKSGAKLTPILVKTTYTYPLVASK